MQGKSEHGKIMGVMLCFFALSGGFLGLGMVWYTYRPELATYTWDSAECMILSSEARLADPQRRHEPPFEFLVAYGYRNGGEGFVGKWYSADGNRFWNWQEVQSLVGRYPAGAEVNCFVNPNAASEAVLSRGGLWLPLGVLVPVLAIVAGLVGLRSLWPWASGSVAPVSISERASESRRVPVWLIVRVVFLIAGGGVFAGVFLGPAIDVIGSASWEEKACTIEFRASHRPVVLYSYSHQGRRYRSSRHRLFEAGDRDAPSLDGQYRAGADAVCFVNPGEPSEAVLDRSFPKMILLGLIPLGFFLAGLVGYTGSQPLRRYQTGAIVLKPRTTSFGRFIGTLLLACIWNGITAMFIRDLYAGWQSGDVSWMSLLFAVIFAIAGIGFLLLTGHSFLAMFNPKPSVTLNPGTLSLGGSATVTWKISGNASAIERLEVWLEAAEEIEYVRGTDTYHERKVFQRIEVADRQSDVSGGAGSVRIPADTMHSFASKHNKIVWLLRITGEVKRWPDVDEEFAVHVAPGGGPW